MVVVCYTRGHYSGLGFLGTVGFFILRLFFHVCIKLSSLFFYDFFYTSTGPVFYGKHIVDKAQSMENMFLEEAVQLNGISSSPEPFFSCEVSQGCGQMCC